MWKNFFLFSYYRKFVKNFNVYILNFKSHYGNINFRKYYQYIFLKNHTECMYSDCIVSNWCQQSLKWFYKVKIIHKVKIIYKIKIIHKVKIIYKAKIIHKIKIIQGQNHSQGQIIYKVKIIHKVKFIHKGTRIKSFTRLKYKVRMIHKRQNYSIDNFNLTQCCITGCNSTH